MAMTVLVTRKVPDRYRGFLASCMCELAPGVYTAPRMNKAVRERIWKVMEEWFEPGAEQSIVMTWRDRTMVGGQRILTLGVPRHEVYEHDGIFLARRELAEKSGESSS